MSRCHVRAESAAPLGWKEKMQANASRALQNDDPFAMSQSLDDVGGWGSSSGLEGAGLRGSAVATKRAACRATGKSRMRLRPECESEEIDDRAAPRHSATVFDKSDDDENDPFDEGMVEETKKTSERSKEGSHVLPPAHAPAQQHLSPQNDTRRVPAARQRHQTSVTSSWRARAASESEESETERKKQTKSTSCRSAGCVMSPGSKESRKKACVGRKALEAPSCSSDEESEEEYRPPHIVKNAVGRRGTKNTNTARHEDFAFSSTSSESISSGVDSDEDLPPRKGDRKKKKPAPARVPNSSVGRKAVDGRKNVKVTTDGWHSKDRNGLQSHVLDAGKPLSSSRGESRATQLWSGESGVARASNNQVAKAVAKAVAPPQPPSPAAAVLPPEQQLFLFEISSITNTGKKVIVYEKIIGPIAPPLMSSSYADPQMQVIQIEGLLNDEGLPNDLNHADAQGPAISLAQLIGECGGDVNVLRYTLAEFRHNISSAGYRYWDKSSDTFNAVYVPSVIDCRIRQTVLRYRVRGHIPQPACIIYTRMGDIPAGVDDLQKATDRALMGVPEDERDEEKCHKKRKKTIISEKEEKSSEEGGAERGSEGVKIRNKENEKKDKIERKKGGRQGKAQEPEKEMEKDEDEFRVDLSSKVVAQLMRPEVGKRNLVSRQDLEDSSEEEDENWVVCSRKPRGM